MVSLSWWSCGVIAIACGIAGIWVSNKLINLGMEPVRLRPAMVRLPGGGFWMGSPAGDGDAEENEQPQRWTEVPAFSLCRTEVTLGQYEAVTRKWPSDCAFGCSDDQPVRRVSWFDAVAYLNKLTDLESRALVALGEDALSVCYEVNGEDVAWIEGCTGYRLPTDAEWEYAARAGTTTRFSFGDDPAVIGEYAWYSNNSEDEVHTVGEKKANPWGLYDMHGNVWEWVWDSVSSYKDGELRNSDGAERGLRGGSFISAPGHLHVTVRRWDGPGPLPSVDSTTRRYSEDLNPSYGFRCARGAGPQR